MLSVGEVKNFQDIKRKWNQFQIERNMPKYQGVVSPGWLTILKREEHLNTLIHYCDKLIKVDQ